MAHRRPLLRLTAVRPNGSGRGPAALPVAAVLVLVLVLTSGSMAPAAAQVSGTVTDDRGAPVEGATVEAWGESLRLASRITDGSGAFHFPPGIASRTTALYAHRLGYRAERVELEGTGAEGLVIRLTAEAIPLPAVDVVAPRELCPRDDDPSARSLWNAARARYADGLDSMGVATYLSATRDVVPRERLADSPARGAALDQRGSSFLLRVSWKRRIEREGYAYPVRRPTAEGAMDSWVYAPLEADLSPHFADPLFGRLHTLSILAEDDGGWRIAFCPRDPRRPSIQGTLHLSQDTTLVSADWAFRTAEPSEEAGGQAVFTGPASTPGRYLLPLEGLTWRKSANGGFVRQHERFEGWIVAPGDSVPFLPSRRDTPARLLRADPGAPNGGSGSAQAPTARPADGAEHP